MSSIHETAYPRFKSEITPRKLADVYTPSPEEQAFARRQGRTLQGRLAVLVLVKTAQRLGYFVKLAEVPPSIAAHIAACLVTKPLTKIEMRDFGPPVRFVRKPATSAFYQNWWLGNEVGWLW